MRTTEFGKLDCGMTKKITFEHLVPNAMPGRFDGIHRPYTVADVLRLRGAVPVRHSIAEHGANRLWKLLGTWPSVHALGASTSRQAVQMVGAGLKALDLSGQDLSEADAADDAGPAKAGPERVRRFNSALRRADQIEHADGGRGGGTACVESWFAPIVAEAGCGGSLESFEIMTAYIDAGAAGVHFDDRLPRDATHGHRNEAVLIPTGDHIRNLVAARLAADIMGVPTVIIARTDAASAPLVTSGADACDRAFIVPGVRTPEGFYAFQCGVDACIARGLAYAPYADILWWETPTPNLKEAARFAEAIHRKFPGKILAYNCSPSLHWTSRFDANSIARFQREIGAMGYKFQFVTAAGLRHLTGVLRELAGGFRDRGMAAYLELLQADAAGEIRCDTAAPLSRDFSRGYLEAVSAAIGGATSFAFTSEATEAAQFQTAAE